MSITCFLHEEVLNHKGVTIPFEVGAFYWTDWAPDIVNSGREEQD